MKSLKYVVFRIAGICVCVSAVAAFLSGCDGRNQESRENGERPAYYIIRDELDGEKTADKVSEILEQQPSAGQESRTP
ncbi:MAG: hypothetical protein HDR26_01915 [Lachnospiraceae bacterium]|nr:hypothetical protein [Lachnospiraceae bacterium]